MNPLIRILIIILFSWSLCAMRIKKEVSSGHSNSTSDSETTDDKTSAENTTANKTIVYETTEEDYEDSENSEDLEEVIIRSPGFVDKLRELHRKNGNKSVVYRSKDINETYDAVNNFRRNMDYLFQNEDNSLGLELLEFVTELDIQISHKCSAALYKVYSAVRNSEIWALTFIDSNGRFPPPGFIEGISSSFGEFHECLDSRTPNSYKEQFEGKYCLLNARLPYPELKSLPEDPVGTQSNKLKVFDYYGLNKVNTVRAQVEILDVGNGSVFHLGICIPSVCTPEEIEGVLNKVLFPITNIPLELERTCYSKSQPIKLNEFQWVSITILSLLVILVIVSTSIDIIGIKNNKSDLLTSFSLTKNIQTLFAKNEKFGALDTIRLLMIFHVHFGHIYQYVTSVGLPGVKKQYSDVFDKVYKDNEMVFARSPLPVDVLFTLSGFLLSYGLIRRLDKSNGRFNYLVFMFQRYLRFFVLVFGSILFIYLLPITGDGPIWEIGVEKFSDGCRNPKILLTNLLFINNFNDEGNNFNVNKCHPTTWFLAALLQLTAFAPIFVLIYFKNQMMGILALIMGIILGLFLAISPLILFGTPPYLQIWELDSTIFANSSSLTAYHTYPTVYVVSFLIGFPFGFLLYKNKTKISSLRQRIFWVLSIGAIFGMYFWHNTFWRTDRSAPLINALLWHTVGKLVFGLGVGWLLFACCTGRAGYLNKVLSWQGFQPIARLSFGIYLLHFLVITHRVFSVKEVYEISFKYIFEHTIVDLIYDIILGFIFYILIECPFSNLFAIAFNRRPAKKIVDENQNITHCGHVKTIA